LDNNKLELIYGFDETEKEKINIIAKENHLPFIKVVKKSMGKMRICEMITGNFFEVYNCKLPSVKVVLFNNFSDDELDMSIKLIRKNFKDMPILAVVTETSINWTFEKLINHLIEERKWARLHNR